MDTKTERKEGERMSRKRKGTTAHAQEATSLRGRGCTPARRGGEGTRGLSGAARRAEGAEGAGRGNDLPARGPASPLRKGRCGLQSLRQAGSGGHGRSPRRKVRAAGPSALSSRWLFRPHRRGRQPRHDAGPAPDGRAGYLKRGESFKHSSKSTVIFILPPPRRRRWKSRGSRGSGRAGNPDGYGGLTAATSTAQS